MRILIVSQYFHPENFRINQLATALKDGGHDVVVVTAEPNYPSGQFAEGYGFWGPFREDYRGIQVIRTPIFARGRGRGWELVLNYLSFVIFASLFGITRVRGRFDACIAWCSSPITIAIPAIVYRFFTATPLAIWVQDIWPETFFAVMKKGTKSGSKRQSRLLRFALELVVKWIYRHSDQIWIQSTAYEKSVLAHGGRLDQLEYVPNWAEDFYDARRWAGIVADPLPPNSLVFAGNLGRAQGLETLIDAAEITRRESPEAHWVFVGDGVLRAWLQEEVNKRDLQSHVTFLPRRPPPDMPKVLKAASAVLVTLGKDAAYAMTVPSKVQSCMAAGRPIIGTLIGEPARLVGEAKCGSIAPAQDPAALAKAVKEFIALPDEERARMGENGNAFYRAHFTQSLLVARILKLLERMRSR